MSDRENEILRERVKWLESMLTRWAEEAYDDVGAWGGYASPYFQNKHDLAGDLDKWAERKSDIWIESAGLRGGSDDALLSEREGSQ